MSSKRNCSLNCLITLSFSILSGKCSSLSGFISNCSRAKSNVLAQICCFKVICSWNRISQGKSTHTSGDRGDGVFENILSHGASWVVVIYHHSIHPWWEGSPNLPSRLHLPLRPKMFARLGYFHPRLRMEVHCSVSISVSGWRSCSNTQSTLSCGQLGQGRTKVWGLRWWAAFEEISRRRAERAGKKRSE